ncbi:MAG: hypothetical protein MR051_02670 [Lentisphaeria bacterium]|nr:hypothetical protein [Lentisphaeria bacterium]
MKHLPSPTAADLKACFADPPAVNTPAYFWFLNGELDPETLRRQLRDLAASGSKMIYPHPLPREFRVFFDTTMSPKYLSKEYFERYKIIVDECRKLGLELCIYDEGGWPSGGACGQVWASDPEHFTRKFVVADGEGRVRVEREKVNPEWTAPLPDVLRPGVTEKFLELTHERYAAHFGADFGKIIKFTFMDEPEYGKCTPSRLTWADDFAEEFQKRKHYDIMPFLADILAMSAKPEVMAARIDYHDVKSQLFVERFMLPIRDWCRRHGLLSGGHLGGEDSMSETMYMGFGHILRTLRAMDAPGVDTIWRQIWQGQRLHVFPKFASSVANQGGNRYVSGEMFGVYGSGLTFEQMRFLIGYMLVCGVNIFVNCAYPLSTRGQRMEGERPHAGNLNPQWKYMPQYHMWNARLSALATASVPEVSTALFYDCRSLWMYTRTAKHSEEHQEHIAARMVESQCDFDYIDDDVLATAQYEAGKVRIGKVLYSRIVIPTGAMLAPEAAANVSKLRGQGAKILSSDAIHTIPPELQLAPRNPNIRLRKQRAADGSAVYFMLNTSAETQRVSCRSREDGAVAAADPDTGRFFAVARSGRRWRAEFAPGELKVFVIGASAVGAGAPPAQPGGRGAAVTGTWKLRKIRQTVVGADDYEVREYADSVPPVPAGLGDWADVLGSDFSGEAEYSIEFHCRSAAEFLDLGQVNYSAAVTLNGRELGVKLAPPYVFAVKGALRRGRNILTVKVTNTLANAIAPDAVRERWERELPFVCPYEYQSRGFEMESLPSGLFGPVTLKKSKKTIIL